MSTFPVLCIINIIHCMAKRIEQLIASEVYNYMLVLCSCCLLCNDLLYIEMMAVQSLVTIGCACVIASMLALSIRRDDSMCVCNWRQYWVVEWHLNDIIILLANGSNGNCDKPFVSDTIQVL